jgi:antitoxin (DNA-binding transcriptional repressor) of toxin-antitoxin stability system
MKTVTKHELTTEIDSLLADLRSSHEMVFITDNGSPVAKLVPLDDEQDDGLLEDDDPFFTLLDELRDPVLHPVSPPRHIAP